MNGKEPQFADAVGNYIPRPLVPPRVASPVSLLDPDRYEFYTFNDDGDLVKRLMTMEEIQSIVANGDSEQQVLAKTPTGIPDNDANILDIVNNVQKVLHEEMANNNFTANLMYNKLDTPDTSSSWSSILPAIFGNTGETIGTSKIPVTTGSTADSIILHTSTSKKPFSHKTSTSHQTTKATAPPKTTTTKLTKNKVKPSSSSSSSSSTSYGTTIPSHSHSTSSLKNKHTSTTGTSSSHLKTTQQNTVKNTLAPGHKTQSTQSITTFTPKPTKLVTVQKPSSLSTKISTAHVQKVTHGSSTIPTGLTNRITASAQTTFPTKSASSTTQADTKRPSTHNKHSSTHKIASTPQFSSSSGSSGSSGSSYVTKTTTPIETQPTKKNRVPETTLIPTTQTKKKTTATKQKLKSTTPIPSSKYTTAKSSPVTAASTIKYVTVSAEPTTRKTLTLPIYPTTLAPKEDVNPDLALIEPEPDNIFDSELSLNQIIESLKDLEGTTMPYPQSMADLADLTTTYDPNSLSPFEKVNTESVKIYNNGKDTTPHTNDFKQSFSSSVTYIPQTTAEYSSNSPITEGYHGLTTSGKTTIRSPATTSHKKTPPYMKIQHKESDDDMESVLDEEITTTEALPTTTDSDDITTTDSSLSKQQTNGIDNLLRESFDTVLSQVQNDGMSTTIDANDFETTTFGMEESTKIPNPDKKKVVVKPTPYISMEELEAGTEPMQYLETIVKHYENEKNKNELKETQTETIEILKSNEVETEAEAEAETEFTTEETTTELSNDFSSDSSSNDSLRSGTESEESTETTTEIVTEDLSLDSESRTENFLKVGGSDESSGFTTESEEMSTIDFIRDSTEKQELISIRTITDRNDETTISEQTSDYDQTTAASSEDEEESSTGRGITESLTDDTSTTFPENTNQFDEMEQAQYEMVQLIEKIAKNLTANEERTTMYSVERKEDTNENATLNSQENGFSDLGEPAKPNITYVEIKTNLTKPHASKAPLKSAPTKLKLPTLAPILNNLKMKVVNALKNTNTINLDPAPKQALGLEESTKHAGEDILEFTRFCNEVAFNFWTVLNNDGGISSARSLVLSPFALTSVLAMLFMGARGPTSGEINDLLHLDDIVTFNPHAILRNISESVDEKKNENVYANAFVRELLSDRSKGKMLSFFKEKVQQFYSGYVEEVNFTTVNDIIRRRTNLLVKRYTGGKVNEYLKTSSVWVKPPLAGISANIFETDCSRASKAERDGEMFFQVLPAIRSRRLVPIPAVVWKSGFTAGYDPELDATAVAIGLSKETISTVFVMPGQQGHSAPGDNLERLESVLMVNAMSKNAWRRLLATLMERPGLEVQIPRFTHRSFVNTTNALRKLGLETLFDQNGADLRGITGSITRDMFVSDLIQINTFSTCGEDKLPEEHHVEMYPAPPNKHRNMDYSTTTSTTSTTSSKLSGTPDYESERGFADPLFDLKYLNLPLSLRPRQARIPEVPRLRFDKPFIYFVRHNPTGMVLYFGRFNPRLLP